MSKKKALAAQVICTFMLVLLLGVSALAAKVTAPKFGTVTLYSVGRELAMVSQESVPLAVSNVKIANKKIATAKVEKRDDGGSITYSVIRLEPVKKGTTTLSFKLKVNGKMKSYKVKVQVKGYVNPFSTLKIGSVNYASRYNSVGNGNFIHTSGVIKGKLGVKLKKGWSLTSETGIYTGNIYGGKRLKAVKNNTNITINNGQYLKIGIYNSAARYTTDYIIAVLKKPAKKVTAPYIPKEQITLPVYPGNSRLGAQGWALISKEGYGLEVKDLKNSNTKVAEVRTDMIGDNYGKLLSVTPKKAGTAKITFKLKINGKWKAYTMKIKAYNYQNPFSSLKIGGKNYTSKHNNVNFFETTKAISGKLSYKLKKGYKLNNILIYDINNGKVLKQKIKNNTKITLKKGTQISFEIRDTKRKVNTGIGIVVW